MDSSLPQAVQGPYTRRAWALTGVALFSPTAVSEIKGSLATGSPGCGGVGVGEGPHLIFFPFPDRVVGSCCVDRICG